MTEFIIRIVRFAHLYSLSFQNYALFAYLLSDKVRKNNIFLMQMVTIWPYVT